MKTKKDFNVEAEIELFYEGSHVNRLVVRRLKIVKEETGFNKNGKVSKRGVSESMEMD